MSFYNPLALRLTLTYWLSHLHTIKSFNYYMNPQILWYVRYGSDTSWWTCTTVRTHTWTFEDQYLCRVLECVTWAQHDDVCDNFKSTSWKLWWVEITTNILNTPEVWPVYPKRFNLQSLVHSSWASTCIWPVP